METVGKISFRRNEELGKGFRGTVVCRGHFEKRHVAVKIVPKNYYKIFQRETLILQDVDTHPNVIRYFCNEEDIQYYYIALEICSCTLDDHILKGFTLNVEIKDKQILYETALGLSHLHKMSIIHRDIKPQNILFYVGKDFILIKLSDFGLAKDLSHDSQSTVGSISTIDNWMAPEISSHHQANKRTDIFSLGCVYYYTLTKGINIKENETNLDSIPNNDMIFADNLIKIMTNTQPNERISARNVTMNPLFWSAEKILDFIVDISNRLEGKDELPKKIKEEMRVHHQMQCGYWPEKLDKAVVDNLQQRRTYNGNLLEDLIRAIRNKKAHYNETPINIKNILGTLPHEFLNYFTSRFPKLIYALYEIANKFLLHELIGDIYLC